MMNQNLEREKLIMILKKQPKFTVRIKNSQGEEREYFNINIGLENNKLELFGLFDLDVSQCSFDFYGEGRHLCTIYPENSDYVWIKIYM
ncbi:hypothetical protein SAMN02745221_01906 [Thermosyntropha lipolytica DSM 11003]|uniref:Uncharacterized protein n=1 Tax=Thermosyntropha lipolytica DSM 11003 TaxID=1123382 RepID=A0A1M5R0M3_9FIRM|nr:hypothetical protein [Thermosyntropha lipolytica]SHH19656.1 hypothetical protein SAMN02745221_01906 [Thermosyntropha lipolytica DSM 11003]